MQPSDTLPASKQSEVSSQRDMRREERFRCDIVCAANSFAGTLVIRIINVSKSGFAFTTQTILPWTQEVTIVLDSGPLAGLSGSVRWVASQTYGVEFFPRHQDSPVVNQFLLSLGSAC